MSDHAAFQMYVFHVPPDKQEAFAGLMTEYGLEPEFEGDAETPPCRLFDDQARTDIVDDLCPALTDMGVSFEMWQDPKYEWDGTYAAHFPQLGAWRGYCNAAGEPYVLASHIDKLIEKWIDEHPTGHATGLIAALNDASGRSWRDRASFERERMERP